MKKTIYSLFAALTVSTISAASAFAFQMSQPVRIGSVSYNMGGGLSFEGANQVKANQFYNTSRNRYTGYDKGYATFDNGKLFIHFINNPRFKIGDSNISNTIPATAGLIYKISTDSQITLYWLYSGDESTGFQLIGRRADGRYVKYADGDKIFEDYINKKGLPGGNTIKSVYGNTILVEYRGLGMPNEWPIVKLQWDDKAQWFSVARIK